MEKGVNMEEAHNWVNLLRERERVTFKELGAVLGMSDRGVANALKNKTLSLSKIEKIASHYERESELKEFLGTKESFFDSAPEESEELPEGKIAIKDIPEYIVKNEKTLVKNQVFRLWLKTKVQEGVIRILGK